MFTPGIPATTDVDFTQSSPATSRRIVDICCWIAAEAVASSVGQPPDLHLALNTRFDLSLGVRRWRCPVVGLPPDNQNTDRDGAGSLGFGRLSAFNRPSMGASETGLRSSSLRRRKGVNHATVKTTTSTNELTGMWLGAVFDLAKQNRKLQIRVYAAFLLVLLAASVLLHEVCFGDGESRTTHVSAQERAVPTGHATMALCTLAVVLALALLVPTMPRSMVPAKTRVDSTPVVGRSLLKPRVHLSFRELCVMRA